VFILPVDETIYLKLLMSKDAKILMPVLQENQEHLKEWLIWAVNLPSQEVYEKEIIPAWLQKFADNNGFEAGIFYNDELVGMIGLHYIDWRNKATEIGYWLSKQYEGNGIITKAVRTVTNYCFKELELNRVLIRAVTENTKSRAIPKRLGFQEEGITRDAQLLHNRYYDVVNYSLLYKDLKEKKC
jgi:ribosomal-protein-serine acetyltransferase